MGNRAEDASIAASLGAQQLPVKLEARAREVEHELNRTVQVSKMFPEFHLDLVKLFEITKRKIGIDMFYFFR